MQFEKRLWSFTSGVRSQITFSVFIGLISTALGALRLALLGWIIGLVFLGYSFEKLIIPVIIAFLAMLLRALFEYWRTMLAHKTSATIQKKLRRHLFSKIICLGPGYIGRQRSGEIVLTLVDGVEQLETYFGEYLPQLLISALTPIMIFSFVAFLDFPVALILLIAAFIALFAPSLWHKFDTKRSLERQKAYAEFAADFLDGIQGLSTLKSFGQSESRIDLLKKRSKKLFQSTMWVLATNSLSRGITDTSIAVGTAVGLGYGAFRVVDGEMQLANLLIILMMGVEIFRPMRDLRTVLHQGMVGLSAAQGIYKILNAKPSVTENCSESYKYNLDPTIDFKSVKFSYPLHSHIVHDSLSFSINKGERVGIVGSSGCGKSSIVKLLLRFHDPNSGSIEIGGKNLKSLSFEQIRSEISVVHQDTFLFHGTIEDNIKMGNQEATEKEIIQAASDANIHEFVKSLPDSYNTIIGEKGLKLSGGQRQRIAIARSILKNASILILDEALSSVDAENEYSIQQALDRLMKERTTLILAHRLSSIIKCDRIFVIDQGKVVESGSHKVLMEKNSIYSALMSKQVREKELDELDDSEEESKNIYNDRSTQIDESSDEIPTEGIIKAEGLNWKQLVVELMRYIMPWKGRLILSFCFGVLRLIAFIGVGVFSALIVLAIKNNSNFDLQLTALILVASFSGLLHWLESWVSHDMAFRLLAEMRINIFRKLDKLAPSYLVRRRTGDLMGIATQDVELVEYFFAHTVAPIFVSILVPIAVISVLASTNFWIAVTLLPFLIAVGLSPFLMREKVDKLGSRAREAAGELSAHSIDTIQGIAEIVAFQQTKFRANDFDNLTNRHIQIRLPFFKELTIQKTLLEILTGLGGLSIIMTGAFLSKDGAIDNGLLPLLTILAMSAFLPVSEIAQIGRQLADTMGATRRIYALENEPVYINDGYESLESSSSSGVCFKNVSFQYPGSSKLILQNLNFEIPTGKTLALVGPSGAGKTTIAQLLIRFWDPKMGSIKLNGIELRNYKLDDLRARVALVAQETYLFNNSLRENILVAKPNATQSELIETIKLSALAEVIQSLPDGLDTIVGERGANLSGGQRQRVAIARAFLKDAPLLILDEATSHLDALSEKTVHESLNNLKKNRTTIIIAHRLSTIRDADRIIVINDGRILEEGMHSDLLKNNSLYKQLVSRQINQVF